MFVRITRVSLTVLLLLSKTETDLHRAETGYCGFGDTCKFLHDRGTCTFDFDFALYFLIIANFLAVE